jgi:hypothetical protein
MVLRLTLKCRKCDPCRRGRQRLWSSRAKAEYDNSPRTWFGTLTLRDEEQFRFLSLARKRLDEQGVDYDQLPFGEQFILRHQQISLELTKYMKRIRKESNASFRYLIVAEQHKSGNPHYHLLLHEKDMFTPVKWRTLARQWTFGFTKWKLINDPNVATYTCKYLSKSSAARVRASLGYGRF